MKEIVIIANLVSAVMLIIVLIFFIRGFIILFRGKCEIRRYQVKGKEAKVIGAAFIIVPIALFALNAMMYSSFDWGHSGTTGSIVVSPIVQSIVYIIGIGIVYFWALSKAKAFSSK